MGKISILFWNIRKKDLTVQIGRLVKKYDVDLIVLAEVDGNPEGIRSKISTAIEEPVFYANLNNIFSKTHVYTRHNSSFTRHSFTNSMGRLSLFRINYPLFPQIILGTVHLLSKKNASDATLAEEARIISTEARRECANLENNRLVICGDFNLNPFDTGMTGISNFYAVMDRNVAQQKTRVVQGREYSMFYNPMWSFFGDYPEGPPGTHYYVNSEHHSTHWHLIDQFLLSPQLLDSAFIDSIEIVTGDGVESFLNRNGLVDQEKFSDHLPIFIKLVNKDAE